MRTFWVCLIAAIVVGIASIETIFVGNFFKQLKNDTTELHALVNEEADVDKQKQLIETIQNQWKKHQGFLSIFLQHKEMEDLAAQISKVEALIIHYDKDELKIEVHQLQFYLENFHFVYDFNLVNIF